MMRNHDDLRFAKSRLETYEALASESYLCLTEDDPILKAMEIKKLLIRCAKQEKHYRVRSNGINYNICGSIARDWSRG